VRRHCRRLGYRARLLRDFYGTIKFPDIRRDRQITADSCKKPKMEILAEGWTASERVLGV